MLRRFAWMLAVLLLSAAPSIAQTPAGRGVEHLSGSASYTFPYFRLFLPDPYVVLYDAYGIIAKDIDFMPAEDSQIIGAITTDPFQSPFRFELSMPYSGRGEALDVDNDDVADTGVQIYVVAVTSNTWDSPFLERRDDYVTGIINSAVISSDIDSFLEFQRGTLMVYAEDGEQAFPSGRGVDGVLFTDDDPSMPVEAGWSMIDITAEPFTINRSTIASMDLLEAEEAELTDFSTLSYTDAFNAMIDHLSREYAFTAYKHIDWEAKRAEFLPRVEEAQRNRSSLAFRRALRDLAWSIPDGHVSGPSVPEDFQRDVSGGLGFVLRELDDGSVIVSYLSPGGAAQTGGIVVGDRILSIDGEPIGQAVSEVVPYTGSFSTPHTLRLEQLRFVHRRPIGTPAKLTIQHADGTELTTSLTTMLDSDSFLAAALNGPLSGTELPVEFRVDPSTGYGIISIYSFSDDLPLTVALWERALSQARYSELPGLIIDIRRNGGGSGFLGDQLPAYFFDESIVIGNTAEYSESRQDFAINPLLEDRFILPPEDRRYDGPVAVLISPDCASACESFAWAMSLEGRAAIVGHYPTAGLGGSVVPISMPDGATFNYTHSRAVDAEGNINIEGIGVRPTVRVPVTEESVLSSRDVLLEAAISYLAGNRPIPADAAAGGVASGGEIEIGQPVTGEVSPGGRIQYQLIARAGQKLDIVVLGDGALARGLAVRLLLPGDSRPLDESYALSPGEPGAGFLGLAIPSDLALIIEVEAISPAVGGTFTLTVRESE